MQHLEVSGAVVLYIGRTVSKGQSGGWFRLWNFRLVQTFLFRHRSCSNFRDQF
jgi:hypothetical protein